MARHGVFDVIMQVFVPHTEELMERFGLSFDELVPFDLGYEVLHLEDPRTGKPLPLPAAPETA
jgi:hypothetical protein